MEEIKIDFVNIQPDLPEEPKTSTFKSFFKRLLSYKFISGLLIVFLLYNVYQLNDAVSPIKDKSEGLIDDIGNFRMQNETFANDLNEIRRYLLLPTKDYKTGIDDDSQQEDLKASVLNFIGAVGQDAYKTDKVDNLHIQVQEAINSENFKEFLTKQSVQTHTFYPEYNGDSVYTFLGFKTEEHGALAYLKGNIVDGTFLIESSSSSKQLGKNLAKALPKAIGSDIKAWIDEREVLLERQKFVSDLASDGDVSTVLTENKLKFLPNDVVETPDAYVYKISNLGDNLVELGVLKDGSKFFVNLVGEKRRSYDEPVEFKTALLDVLKNLDLRSSVEKMVSEKKAILEETFDEKAFSFFLKEFGGTLSSEPKEESDRYVYELMMGDQLLGSIVLEKGTGLVKVIRGGEQIGVSVFDFVPETKKKI